MSAPRFFVRRDTPAWRIQVWTAFSVSALLCAHAVWNLPGDTLDRILVGLGMFFVLSSAFTLAKTVRDNQHETVDTPAWLVQVWAAFGISVTLTGWAIVRLDIETWHQWMLGASSLFLLSSAFTLAKMVRDEHEAHIVEQAQRARAGLPPQPTATLPAAAEPRR